jgi:hypothetical protein
VEFGIVEADSTATSAGRHNTHGNYNNTATVAADIVRLPAGTLVIDSMRLKSVPEARVHERCDDREIA